MTGPRRFGVPTPIVLVGLWLGWASGLIAVKLGLERAEPLTFAAMRVVVSVVVLAITIGVMVALRGRAAAAQSRELHLWALLIGAANVTVLFVAQSMGMKAAGAALSSVLIYTQPFMVALGARWLLKEHLSSRRVAGLIVGWVGIVILVLGELQAGATPGSAMLWLLVSAIAWAASSLLFKLMPSRIPVIPLLFWMHVYGGAPLVVLAALRGFGATWDTQLVLATLWVGVMGGIGGVGLNFVLLRRGEASVVSSWIFAVPVLTSALGVIVLGEHLEARLFVAGVVVAFGIALVNWSRKSAKRPAAVAARALPRGDP